MKNELTEQEIEVINMSADLWNAICELPEQFSPDVDAYMLDINNIQSRLMARLTARIHPDLFRQNEQYFLL